MAEPGTDGAGAPRLLPIPALGFETTRCVLVPRVARVEPPLELTWLAPRERRAGERLTSRTRRADWLAGRLAAKLAMREALGADVDLADLTVAYGSGGRPLAMRGDARAKGLWLAISHTGALGLAAASRGPRPIGVDVERTSAWSHELADYALTDAEHSRLPAGVRTEAVLACWTLKEAALKALGIGLRVHPRRLEVDVDPSMASAEATWRVTLPGAGPRSGRGWFQRDAGLTWAVASPDPAETA